MALIGDTASSVQRGKPAPALKLNFLSHGTLESRDLAFSRRFYEEFLGLEVVQTSPISLLIRLGGPNTIAVVYSKNVGEMNLLNHNGLDVRSQEEVDEAHRIVCAQAEQWHLKKISKPHPQHGTYSFFFWDGDDNCWEILTNPKGGYCLNRATSTAKVISTATSNAWASILKDVAAGVRGGAILLPVDAGISNWDSSIGIPRAVQSLGSHAPCSMLRPGAVNWKNAHLGRPRETINRKWANRDRRPGHR